MNLITEAQLADEFGVTVEKVREWRKRHNWPHVRLGRFEVRFTESQVEQIVAMHSQAPKKAESVTVEVAGQTARSASRRRSA